MSEQAPPTPSGASPADPTTGARPGRRGLVLAGAGLVVALAVVLALVLGGDDPQPGAAAPTSSAGPTVSPDASASPTPTPTAAPTEPAAAPTDTATPAAGEEDPASPAPSGAPGTPGTPGAVEVPPVFGSTGAVGVPAGEAGTAQSGLTARVVGVERMTSAGTGIGQVNGDAVEVVIEVSNPGGGAASLEQAAVSAYTADTFTPSSPADGDERVRELPTSVPAGGTVEGRYIFNLPDGGEALTVAVLLDLDEPVLVFDRVVPANG